MKCSVDPSGATGIPYDTVGLLRYEKKFSSFIFFRSSQLQEIGGKEGYRRKGVGKDLGLVAILRAGTGWKGGGGMVKGHKCRYLFVRVVVLKDN